MPAQGPNRKFHWPSIVRVLSFLSIAGTWGVPILHVLPDLRRAPVGPRICLR